MIGILIKRENLESGRHGEKSKWRDRDRQWSPTSLRERSGINLSLPVLRMNQSCWLLDFSKPQNCETKQLFCLNHSTCGTLLQKLQKTNTAGLMCLIPLCPYLPWSSLFSSQTSGLSQHCLYLPLSATPSTALALEKTFNDYLGNEFHLQRAQNLQDY